LAINRLANLFLRTIFAIRLNDTTNAFKAYRREVIDGCRPLISPHFIPDSRASIKSHCSRIFVDSAPDHLAEPADRVKQSCKSVMKGQPLSVHLPVRPGWRIYFCCGDYKKRNGPEPIPLELARCLLEPASMAKPGLPPAKFVCKGVLISDFLSKALLPPGATLLGPWAVATGISINQVEAAKKGRDGS
jgi:hypothetical protein